MAKQSKPRRYAREREWYEAKLARVMAEFGLAREAWELRYDRWEGAALDFTYKGVTRRFERVIDKQTIHYASDCLAQIVLWMEKMLWAKREGIFDLDVMAAGLPELPPPIPECFRTLGFGSIPADAAAITDRYRALAKERHPDNGGSNEAFAALKQAAEDAKKYLEASS